jgi:hypothetical protein
LAVWTQSKLYSRLLVIADSVTTASADAGGFATMQSAVERSLQARADLK